jgi:dGTPase
VSEFENHYALEDKYDAETVRFAQESERELEGLNQRLYAEHRKSDEDRTAGEAVRRRDEFWRDYARILYSSSFRRLQGKMQLLGVDQTRFFRNRLTHSLEVSQIARGIAAKLKLSNPLVAEACSLTHDLGNPPFGHSGERVLSDAVGPEAGHYEGNAQTLRILMQLEKKLPDHGGLNLTLRTLLGTIKYDRRGYEGGQIAQPDKAYPKYIYKDDYETIHEWLRRLGKGSLADGSPLRTIDVQVMDLADEIAYAAHDLEDCLSAGQFTIDELIHEFHVNSRFSGEEQKLESIVDGCKSYAKRSSRIESSEEYAFVFQKELTSRLVHRLINDIAKVEKDNREELGYKEGSLLAEGLKKLVFEATLRSPDVHLYEKQGEQIISGLFQVYTDKHYNDEYRLLPPEYRRLDKTHNEEIRRKRLAADYIGGMQDSFAIQEYKRHFGSSALDAPYPNKPSKSHS